MSEGLPDNLVQAITQSSDGYLWVGTREGLARFDGMEFTSFTSKNTPAIKNSSVTALCATVDGALWIGTDGGGLLCLKNGEFTRFDQPQASPVTISMQFIRHATALFGLARRQV